MDFRIWLTESSVAELYDSAVKAFPATTMRQHATQPIKVTNIHWTPHPHFKTLYVRGLAQSEGREYNPTVLFKKVKFHPHAQQSLLTIAASNGQRHYIEQLSLEDTPVQLRCNCGDFHYRFRYYNFLDHSLFGPKGKEYASSGLRGPINPTESPGMCKHVMKLMQALHQAQLIV